MHNLAVRIPSTGNQWVPPGVTRKFQLFNMFDRNDIKKAGQIDETRSQSWRSILRGRMIAKSPVAASSS